MRLAILADIHSNWEAFQAVLESCHEQDVRQIFCLGDVVGYGANPKECLDLIKSMRIPTVAGNHDWAVCDKIDTSGFNPVARLAVEWTKNILDAEEIDFLKQLELIHHEDRFVMVHGSLNKPRAFHYIEDMEDTQDTFYLMQKKVCFIGHTHVPRFYKQIDSRVDYAPLPTLTLDPVYKYIVNVGSVGQPRDGNPMACFCVYDTDRETIDIIRVHYNVEEARRKILEAQLPGFLAQRLLMGR